MSYLKNLQLMSRYNQLMNQKLIDAASNLSAEEIRCDRGAFFGSILGSLNHIYVADIIWLRRFATHPKKYKIEQLPELLSYTNLNQTVANDLQSMSNLRQSLDMQIINWCQGIKAEDLESNLHYQDTKGNAYRKNCGQLIYHFFNHQTHHRGQISTLISQQGLDIGVTDLLQIIPEQKIN